MMFAISYSDVPGSICDVERFLSGVNKALQRFDGGGSTVGIGRGNPCREGGREERVHVGRQRYLICILIERHA